MRASAQQNTHFLVCKAIMNISGRSLGGRNGVPGQLDYLDFAHLQVLGRAKRHEDVLLQHCRLVHLGLLHAVHFLHILGLVLAGHLLHSRGVHLDLHIAQDDFYIALGEQVHQLFQVDFVDIELWGLVCAHLYIYSLGVSLLCSSLRGCFLGALLYLLQFYYLGFLLDSLLLLCCLAPLALLLHLFFLL